MDLLVESMGKKQIKGFLPLFFNPFSPCPLTSANSTRGHQHLGDLIDDQCLGVCFPISYHLSIIFFVFLLSDCDYNLIT